MIQVALFDRLRQQGHLVFEKHAYQVAPEGFLPLSSVEKIWQDLQHGLMHGRVGDHIWYRRPGSACSQTPGRPCRPCRENWCEARQKLG